MLPDRPVWELRTEYSFAEIVSTWRRYVPKNTNAYVTQCFDRGILEISKSETVTEQKMIVSGGVRGEEPQYAVFRYLVHWSKGRHIQRAEEYLFFNKVDQNDYHQPSGDVPDILLDEYLDFYSVAERWAEIDSKRDSEHWEGVLLQLLEKGCVFLRDPDTGQFVGYSSYKPSIRGHCITSESLHKEDMIRAEILLGLRQRINIAPTPIEEPVPAPIVPAPSEQVDLHRDVEGQKAWMNDYILKNGIDKTKDLSDSVMKKFREAAYKVGMTENSLKTRCREMGIRGIDRKKLKK